MGEDPGDGADASGGGDKVVESDLADLVKTDGVGCSAAGGGGLEEEMVEDVGGGVDKEGIRGCEGEVENWGGEG